MAEYSDRDSPREITATIHHRRDTGAASETFDSPNVPYSIPRVIQLSEIGREMQRMMNSLVENMPQDWTPEMHNVVQNVRVSIRDCEIHGEVVQVVQVNSCGRKKLTEITS